jgi:hypothetical protein
MKKISRLRFLFIAFLALSSHGYAIERQDLVIANPGFNDGGFQPDLFKNRVVPIFMMVVGAGMLGMWTADMASGKFSGQGNFFRWREGENMLWPHIAAEFLTGAGLIAGGIGLYTVKDWGLAISLLSLGAVTYSAINSTGWVLAEKGRTPYGIPMWVSLAGAVASFVILLY